MHLGLLAPYLGAAPASGKGGALRARKRPVAAAPVALLYTGQSARWAEDAERGLLEHGVLPLLAEHGGVDVHVCVDAALDEATSARLALWPVRVRVWAVGESTQQRRGYDCLLAMQGAGEAGVYEWWVFIRLGLVLFAPLELPPTPQPDAPPLLFSRARLAGNMPEGLPLTSWHFSWLNMEFDGERCVDGCVAGCMQAFDTAAEGLWVSDDALVAIPKGAALAFFDAAFFQSERDFSECLQHFSITDFWHWIHITSEFKFTCAILAQGVSFAPWAARAQLSMHQKSNTQAELQVWGGRVGLPPEKKTNKNCLGKNVPRCKGLESCANGQVQP